MLQIKTLGLAISLLAFAFVAVAQPAAPSPEAKKYMSQGLEAAKEKNWDFAALYFLGALLFDITAPAVLFNLAYANDQIGVDELRTISYYRAYLASAPNSKRAAPIRKRIAELETRTKAKVMKLFPLVERIASALPSGSMDRKVAFTSVAVAHAAIGNFEAALSRADRLKIHFDITVVDIAKFQAEYGDITGARKTIKKLKKTENNARFFAHLAKVQAETGDIDRALATAALISGKYGHIFQPSAYLDISRHLIAVGDYSRAKAALTLAKQTMKPESPYWGNLSGLLAKTGNFDEAWEIATIAKTRKYQVEKYYHFTVLAEQLAFSGDFKGAQKALDEVPTGSRNREKALEITDTLELLEKSLQEATNDQERQAAKDEIRKYKTNRPDDLEGQSMPLLNREILHWVENPVSILLTANGIINSVQKNPNYPSAQIQNIIGQIMTTIMRQRRLAAYWQARRQRAERPNATTK